MARLDQAVRRVLALKAQLGLFDDPFRRIDPRREKARVRTPQHLKLSREAGARSIVMLKNDGDLLPLPKSGRKIALIGPFVQGQRELIGTWNVYGSDAEAVDLLTGVRAAVTDPSLVTAVDGSGITDPIPGGIEAAVIAASQADVVLLAIGESQRMSGEAQSRVDIGIPQAQLDLAEAVLATGKPTVILLRNGRAMVLDKPVLDARAILVTWFLGSQSGPATADILFGDVGPRRGCRSVSLFDRAAALLLCAQDHRATQPAGAAGGIQGALSRGAERGALRVRARPDLWSHRLQRSRPGRRAAEHRWRAQGPGAHHQQRHARCDRGGTALHP
ncbi:glycoside hydrolase family 3 C-terminal domain-containing protein [Sphingomonas hankookensis]|uniref:glycoside hydrolase family 3 C-terminal domain-containing protein n=1 Tax=Sphingomonas hankookensis TaxID=563996 RepID=UPI003D303D10